MGLPMRFPSLSGFLLLCLLTMPVSYVTAQGPTEYRETMRAALARVLPSVVTIETRTQKPPDRLSTKKRTVAETGIGFALKCGTKIGIITNHHVVADVPLHAILLTLHDLRFLRPTKIISSEEFDIAVLLIDAELPAAPVANSDLVEMADPVLAIGSPFGLKESVSAGIISAKNRLSIPSGNHKLPLHGFFQTDTPINPGNSGGPLLSLDGHVIGMVTAIASAGGQNEGVAFAIPINNVIHIATELLENGNINRPHLGLELDPKFDAEARTAIGFQRMVGARIRSVQPGAAAAMAGFLPDDIVLRYSGIEVENDLHFIHLVARSKIGDRPEIVLLRDNRQFFCRPTLASVESPVTVTLPESPGMNLTIPSHP